MSLNVLPNADIHELDPGIVQPDDELPFWSKTLGRTLKVKASELVPSQTSNFEWSSTGSYDEDEVVTRGGLWWQSLIDDNEGIAPGSDPLAWVAVPKAVGFGWWAAGVYAEAKPMVLSDHSGQTRWYRLVAAIPYVSTDIEDEEEMGDWSATTELVADGTVAVDDAVELDCKFFSQIIFSIIGTVSDDIEFTLARYSKLRKLTIKFNTDTPGKKVKFPAIFRASNAQWDPVLQTYEIVETGPTIIEAIDCGGLFYLTTIIPNLI